MAAPNIVNVATITGKSAVANVTTVATDIVTNSAASGQLHKIDSLVVSNVNGTATANITASLYRSTIEYKIAHLISVPAQGSLVVISKDTMVYLEEGDTIRLTSSANNYLHAVCSYEIIS
jgi:hypothetical protein